jgi:hypothetical protein
MLTCDHRGSVHVKEENVFVVMPEQVFFCGEVDIWIVIVALNPDHGYSLLTSGKNNASFDRTGAGRMKGLLPIFLILAHPNPMLQ